MRVVFAGTPQAAVPSLAALLESPHEVAAVVTRPDSPRGRGRSMGRSEVGQLADEAGIPVLTPGHPRDEEFVAELTALAPDCVPVVAYGALVPEAVLAIPRWGWINLHFSLLPAWRGAAPVQHAILAGDAVTGATTFQLDRGMDTGPFYGMVTETIHPRDTAGDLLERLSVSGAQLLLATLDGLELGRLTAQPQPSDGVSLAPKLTADDVRVHWDTPAMHIDRLVRAAAPAPGAWTTLSEQRVKLGRIVLTDSGGLAPGEIRVEKGEVLVGTLTTAVVLGEVRPSGKRAMAAPDWVRGLRLSGSERLR